MLKKDPYFIVYKIYNDINDKIYIGVTSSTLENRWVIHAYNSKEGNLPLYLDIRKYGINHFKIKKIDKMKFDSVRDANNLEGYWIHKYNCLIPNGYNKYSKVSRNITRTDCKRIAINRRNEIKRLKKYYSN